MSSNFIDTSRSPGVDAAAKEADSETTPDGMNIPEEITRRQDRLVAIAETKEKIEQRAAERFAWEQKEYEDKIAARKEKAEKTAGSLVVNPHSHQNQGHEKKTRLI